MFDQSAVMQKYYVLCKPSGLAHVVGHDNHFDTTVLGADEKPLDGERRSGIEARSRLIEQEHLWIETESASKAEPLLLAARKHPRRCKSVVMQSGKLQGPQRPRGAFAARNAAYAERVGDVCGRGPAEKHRPLEDHGLAASDFVIHRRVAPKNCALGRLKEPMYQSK